jgi:hypothetical protein
MLRVRPATTNVMPAILVQSSGTIVKPNKLLITCVLQKMVLQKVAPDHGPKMLFWELAGIVLRNDSQGRLGVYINEVRAENVLLSAGREVAGPIPLSDRAAFPL